MKMIATVTRVLAPASFLAATGTPFRGRAVPSDRRTPAGVDLGATPTPRGTSMI